VIAIDGKTVRGAKDKAGKAPHLVAALAHGIGAVLGQVAVDAKSNEIPAVRELLKAFAAHAPDQAWKRRSCGNGSKGPRVFDWAAATMPDGDGEPPGWSRYLLVRRSLTRNAKGELELAYYLCCAPAGTADEELIRVAGSRWAVEMVFTQLAKRAVRPLGGGRQDVPDLDLVVGDDHPVDEQFGQLPSLRERGRGESGPDGLAECLDAVGHGLQFETLFSCGA